MTYTVIVSTGNCTDTAIAIVTVNPIPTVYAGADITINQGETTFLMATGNGTSYDWSCGMTEGFNCINCQNPTTTPQKTTTYCVTTTLNGCEAKDSVTIIVEFSCGEIYVPGAFSPNGDGENDVLFVRGSCIKAFGFSVFTRWGEKVFETDDITEGWDGTGRERVMNSAVFVYYMNATLIDDKQINKKGNVSLIR